MTGVLIRRGEFGHGENAMCQQAELGVMQLQAVPRVDGHLEKQGRGRKAYLL